MAASGKALGVPPRGVRYTFALILAAVAVFSGLWAYHALEPLWGYQDNDTLVYLALGLPAIVVSVAAIVGIVLLLRLAPPRPGQKLPRERQARH